jgi:PAS domain S-box-containing protein
MELVHGSEALDESEKLIRTFFDSMPQLGWAAQASGFVDLYNRRFYEYSGCTVEELEGWGWQKVLSAEMLPIVLDRWKHSLATFENFEMKIPLRRHDGVYRWFLTRATPMFDAHGKCLRWVGINTDIQDEIDQTHALAQSEQEFRLLADSLPDLVWIADGNFSCRYVNKRWIDYTGVSASEASGSGWLQIAHPDDLSKVTKEWEIPITEKKMFEGEQRLKSADGSYRWFLVRGTPVIDDQNNATSWFGTCTDIHVKKQASEHLEKLVIDRGQQLAHVEAFSDTVIESISDGIVLADPNNKLTYVNQAARDMLGNHTQPASLRDVVENKRNYDSSGERLLSVEELPLARAMKGQLVNDAEMMLKSTNGDQRIVSVSARPIIDKNGDFKGAVAVVRDITARKTAELALQQARDEAVEANKLKSQFVANISHEIRTPMSGILGFSELLLDEAEGQAKEFAERIFASAQQLMRLVSDLLDFSKAEAGKIVVAEENVRLDQLVDDVCSTFYGSAARKQVKLLMEIEPALSCEVRTDGNLIRQILLNLVQNAIKFTDVGSVKVKAEIESGTIDPGSSDQLRVKFSVQDTGVGISPVNQKLLFQLFVQVDGSTTRRHGGTGLGLALSKRLVELLNGEISVVSAEGEGSTFTVILPLAVCASQT